MKRVLGSVVVLGLFVAAVAVPAQAQLGIGIKVPPLVLPQVFVSFWLNEGVLLEASGSIAGFGPAASISVAVNGKLFFEAVSIADINFHPFLSAGGGVTMVSVGVPGFGASTAVAIGGAGGGGMEHRFNDLPLAVFADLSIGLVVTPIFGFGFGGGIGARWEF